MIQINDDGRVYLMKDKPISIGRIKEVKGKKCYFKNEDESNIFRKLNAWSINAEVLPYCEAIYYITKRDIYKLSTFDALNFGEYRTYQEEEKLYVPLTYWLKKSEI